MSNKVCRLCLQNNADKKGSHIVPHFLLKRIENIEGKTGRDYELGFTLGKGKTGSHFGRSVPPEKLEEVYGEVSNQDIASNSHPLIVDLIFCSNCEKRLAKLESVYAESLKKLSNSDYESGVTSIEGMLFWTSIIWRMSINGKSGTKLSDSENETLRKFIDDYLVKNLVDSNSLVETTQEISKIGFSYRLLRCYECKKDDSRYLLFHPDFNQPIILLIDEFVLAFTFTGTYEDLNSKNCFKINELILDSPIVSVTGPEKVRPFSRQVYMILTTEVIERTKTEYKNGVFEKLELIHQRFGYDQPLSEDIKYEVLRCLAFEEEKLGRAYTDKELARCAFKVLKRLYI
jgi:hypothetical protein